MRPHAYMHTETEMFRLQQDESEIFHKLFTVSQMRLSVQGPITFRCCDKLGLKAKLDFFFSFMHVYYVVMVKGGLWRCE